MEQNLPCDTSGKINPGVPQNRFLWFANFLRDKFARWAENGSCVEEIWKNVKVIISESIAPFVPQTILKKNHP
jgi:hypothetical protein